ncbi:pseudouridine synthase [Chelatococcus sambhunathii]|uniref:Pseudouridine synthase n=1 Tax=Chelatococcus sambhunathii TaxID=363953 RepID=A0ABU1DI19_9HYPH|nr:pseudouridine synthase [Chelatococcus sambhunathii]MDR4307550.1 pseudouridine synthase [Chelatococcus sambhunathii]
MTDEPEHPDAPEGHAAAEGAGKRPGERLAKTIARAGLGSRREAEAWIEAGRVSVNGATVTEAGTNVVPSDRIEVDGKPLPARERTRLWLYHKPRGYVTTTHDPEGRETVFSILPKGMPRVMTIGRLDINTEGLLLLTNDGGLARVLELPDTGWLRRYRVRAFGRTTPEALAALKDGVEIDGFAYGAIDAEIERQQADNVWLRFGLREGKNREVKRVAEHLGLAVNRLIRISFGPFQLGSLPEGAVEEVRGRTLQEQLGKRLAEEAGCDFEGPATSLGEDAPRVTGGRGGARTSVEGRVRARLADPSQRVGRKAPIARPRDMPAPAAPSGGEPERPAKTKRVGSVADRRGRAVKVERIARDHAEPAPKRVRRAEKGTAERFGAKGRPERARPDGGRKSDAGGSPRGRPASDRSGPRSSEGGRGARPAGERMSEPAGDASRAPRLPGEVRPPRVRAPRSAEGERPRFERDEGAGEARGERRPRERSNEGRPQRGERGAEREGARPFRADRPDRAEGKPAGFRPRGEGKPGDADRGRPRDGAPRSERPAGGKPGGFRRDGGRPEGGRPEGGRPGGRPGGKPGGGRPGGGKPGGGKPGGRPGGGGGRGRPGGADRRR